jgi:hypothetical protein
VQTTAVQPIVTEVPSASCTLITGYVIAGGDTTPEGLSDAPRQFVYEVKGDDSNVITVVYHAFPPGPANEAEKIRLNFHAGEVITGDYMRACGQLDSNTHTLVIARSGHYIETYPKQP